MRQREEKSELWARRRGDQQLSVRQRCEFLQTASGDPVGANKKLLTETQEQGVHAHGVHAEEAMGNQVGSHYHRLRGRSYQKSQPEL